MQAACRYSHAAPQRPDDLHSHPSRVLPLQLAKPVLHVRAPPEHEPLIGLHTGASTATSRVPFPSAVMASDSASGVASLCWFASIEASRTDPSTEASMVPAAPPEP